ncbi:methyl-accepting chemotaxis protein [Clostridium sp.]|uniref:methyl-accepting chemotaxis protein n=1 Tax=Clostridium sp. TaxID=1506 RepID=UPI003993F053
MVKKNFTKGKRKLKSIGSKVTVFVLICVLIEIIAAISMYVQSQKVLVKSIINTNATIIADIKRDILDEEKREKNLKQLISNAEVDSSIYLFEEGKPKELTSSGIISIGSTGEVLNSINSASSEVGAINVKIDGKSRTIVYDKTIEGNRILFSVLNQEAIKKQLKPIKMNVIYTTIIVMILAIVGTQWLSKSINKSVKILKESLKKIAEGDLREVVLLKTGDEFEGLADSINKTQESVKIFLSKINENSEVLLKSSENIAAMAEETTASSTEVSKAMEEISTGTISQSNNAQQSLESMEVLSMQLVDITGITENMSSIAKKSNDIIEEKGNAIIESLIEKYSKSKAATQEFNTLVIDVAKSTDKINVISNSISQITEQTNLLALNASIEAARAGEAGRGFAVVADEIRKLAEQSKKSTEEIKNIIEEIRQKSIKVTESIEDSKIVVKEQEEAMFKTKEIFGEILKHINEVNGNAFEIKSFVEFINMNKETVVEEMENVASVSQQIASSTEEVTASTEEVTATMEGLTKHTEDLEVVVQELKEAINIFELK